jgi:hypothetical protein
VLLSFLGIIKQSNTFVLHLNQQALSDNETATKLLGEFGSFIVEPIDDNVTLVVYERPLADRNVVQQGLTESLKTAVAGGVRVDSVVDYLA